MRDPPSDRHSGMEAACWFCEHVFPRRQILRDGIIRSRVEASGGPYRLYICPSCSRENVCERSKKGRWFASPNYRFSLLDYLFSQILDNGGESARTLLAAITWFRENEERRRYFFERDGDRRYSRKSFLRRLWPLPPGETAAEPPPRRPHAAPDSREEPVRPAPAPRRIVTPYEILGLRAGASEREIRDAFHRLAIHHHPDKVRHLGEEFERMAHDKFRRLLEAYETLMP